MKKLFAFLFLLSIGLFTIGCGDTTPAVKKVDAEATKKKADADAAAAKKKTDADADAAKTKADADAAKKKGDALPEGDK